MGFGCGLASPPWLNSEFREEVRDNIVVARQLCSKAQINTCLYKPAGRDNMTWFCVKSDEAHVKQKHRPAALHTSITQTEHSRGWETVIIIIIIKIANLFQCVFVVQADKYLSLIDSCSSILVRCDCCSFCERWHYIHVFSAVYSWAPKSRKFITMLCFLVSSEHSYWTKW